VLLFQLGVLTYRFAAAAGAAVSTAFGSSLSRFGTVARRYLGPAEQGTRTGVFARAWPIGVTALWIAVLLTGYVLVYYF
jgi:multicomponent Na+:H+ antiporter subunit D